MVPSVQSHVQPLDQPQRIGTLARSTGLSVKTIRFYCDAGLIRPVARSEGGYRLFDARAGLDLTLIRTLRGLDIPLGEIRSILEARRSGTCTCQALQARLRQQSQQISRQIEDLQLLQSEIADMIGNWQTCGGRNP